MTDKELMNNLCTLFPEYEIELTPDGYIHGRKPSKVREVRHRKDLYRIGDRTLFVSTFLYPGEDRSFKYGIINTNSQRRGYRCRNWNDLELFKGFTSGKTNQELYENVASQFPAIKEDF